MADIKTVAVRLVAMHDDFKRGMKESGDATSAFGKTSTVALAAAGAAAVAFAVKSVSAYEDYGRQIMKLSRISGESMEASSKLAYAAKMSGLEADQFSNGIKFMEKAMVGGSDGFVRLGVATKDSEGHFRGARSVLLDTADAIKNMSNGAEKSALIVQLFGRSGLAMGPLLNKGRQGIVALEEEAKKFNLVLTQDNAAAITANVQAHRNLDRAWLGLQMRIGQDVMPVMTAITEVMTNASGPIVAIAPGVILLTAALGTLAAVGPKVKKGFEMVTENGTLKGDLMAAGALVAIGLIMKGLDDVKKRSEETSTQLNSGIDFRSYSKAAEGINKEAAAVNRMGDAWNKMNVFERAQNLGDLKVWNDASAQAEEDQKHFAVLGDRIRELGKALGVTAPEAAALQERLKVDLTQIDPSKYVPIFKELAAGTITQSDAEARLAAAVATSTGSLEDKAEALKRMKDETKAANDEEAASLNPQFAAIDAQRKLEEAQRNVAKAETSLTDAHRAVADAQDNVSRAEERRQTATQKVTDAIAAQRDAQQRLNELLSGPTEDEQLNIESAAIALEEAKRRAAGITAADPALDQRRNALDVRRAELSLSAAEAAHGVAVETARKNEADARQAVLDAQREQTDSIKGVDDANRGLATAVDGVKDAELRLSDSHLAVGRAAVDLDTANRNLMLGFADGEVSVDRTNDALKRWVAQGIVTKEEAYRLATAFLAIKTAMDAINPDAESKGTSSGLSEEQRKAALASNGVLSNQGRAAIEAEGHASGGSLGEGWNLLGEQGPELTYKRGGLVRVATSKQTRGMLTPHPPGIAVASASSDSGYTHNGDIIVGTATERTPADIVWEQRKMATRMRRR